MAIVRLGLAVALLAIVWVPPVRWAPKVVPASALETALCVERALRGDCPIRERTATVLQPG